MVSSTNWYFILVIIAVAFACTRPPDYPDEPLIDYIGLSKSVIAQGNTNAAFDTVAVIFGFTDGDGNLGYESDSIDVFLTDSRDGFKTRFKLPVLPDQGTGNGVSGEITLKIPNKPFNICCTFPDGSTACQPNQQFRIDTFSFEVQIRDREGNFSNSIQTETITIRCD